jgi:hypothetical protein
MLNRPFHNAIVRHDSLLFVGLYANRERPMSTNWCASVVCRQDHPKYTANKKTWAHPNEIGDSTGLVTLSYTMNYMSDRLPNSLLFPDVIPETIVRGGRSSHGEENYRANFTLKKFPHQRRSVRRQTATLLTDLRCLRCLR